MAILRNKCISLVPLKKEDIEMVRSWRNDREVSQFMAFREQISPEQQIKWFDSINNDRNRFFVIQIHEQPVGLTEFKKIDFEKREAEAGIFIHDKKYHNSIFPCAISILLLDYGFGELNLGEVLAHILDSNRRAVRYNKFLGFETDSEPDASGNRLYHLTKSRYLNAVGKYRKIIQENLDGFEEVGSKA